MSQPSGLMPLQVPFYDYGSADSAVEADSKLFADNLSGPDAGLVRTLSEHLMPRMAWVGQWPLQFVIDLARRGRINVSARYERRAWSISLGADQYATRQWLASQQQHCQRRLARQLGQSVRVQVIQERR